MAEAEGPEPRSETLALRRPLGGLSALGVEVLNVGGDGAADRCTVLVHSSGLDARQWRFLQPHLAGFGVAVNLTGYPGGPVQPSGSVVEADLELLEVVTGSLDRPVDLVGHSYGGALATWFSIRFPERVRRVAVHEPVLWGLLSERAPQLRSEALAGSLEALTTGQLPAGEEWLKRFVSFWSGPLAWRVMSQSVREGFLATADKVFAEVQELLSDATGSDAYRTLEVPVLVTCGATTPEAQKAVCRYVAEACPDARLLELPGGHMAPLTHRDAYARGVRGFLGSES